MKEIYLNRQLLGLEDFLFGVGTVLQTRAGQQVEVTKINAGNLPFNETQSLIEWAQSVNLEELGAMVDELQALYTNITMLNNVEDNLSMLDTVENNLVNINKVASNETNINKVATNETNINIVSNDTTEINALAAITTELHTLYVNISAIQNNSNNITAINSLYTNMTSLLSIYTNIIPNLTEILNVDTLAAQVAQDKLDVASMKVAVETIYDTFDDRFLGAKTTDPVVDNDGNSLIDGAMYFNSSSNSLKVYSLTTHLWYTIPQIYLSGLLDVQLTSVTTGDILTWNGTKWVNTRTPSFDSVKLNGGTGTAGTTSWNNAELTLDVILNSNVTLQVGQEQLVSCKNTTGSIIPNGKVVMATGTTGNSGQIIVGLHDGTKANARRVMGIATEDILNNGIGFVTIQGKVRGLNTTGSTYGESWVDGDILYVKANGALTKVEPLDTELKMPIAFVLHSHTNGTLIVRTTGIDENHDRDLIATKAPLNNPSFTNNISIGGAPLSNWSNLKVMEGYGGVFFGGNSVSALTGSNAYYGGTWKYKGAGSAGLQLVNQGSHQFRVADAGVADGAITWITTANIDKTGFSSVSGTSTLPTYSFLTDLDTGIYNPSANELGFVTGGVERLRLDNLGNLKGSGTQSFNGFGGSGFKNYIINGNFEVNQRANTLSSNSASNQSGVFIDMWRYANTGSNNNLNLSQDTIIYNGTAYKALKAIAPTAITNNGALYSVYTSIEDKVAYKLQNKVFTVSFLAEVNNAGNYSFNIRKVNDDGSVTSSYVKLIPLVAGVNKVTITVPADSAYISSNSINGRGLNICFGIGTQDSNTTEGWVSGNFASHLNTFKWWNVNGGYLKVAQFQLEEGSVATPFENRPYGLELSLCQRYCFNPKYGADGSNQVIRGDCYGVDATNGWINFKFPVTMRSQPTLYLSNGFSSLYLGYPDAIILTGLTQNIVSCNEAVFAYIVASGNTAYKHYNLYMPNATHQILFVSEL